MGATGHRVRRGTGRAHGALLQGRIKCLAFPDSRFPAHDFMPLRRTVIAAYHRRFPAVRSPG